MLFKTIQIALFSTLALATPIFPGNSIFGRSANATDLISGIATGAATNCSGLPASGECATVAHATPFLISAMNQYNVRTYGEIGAVIALMAFETNNFQYNINHFPGRPGQGTRNMQMIENNLLYAQSITALKGPLAGITTATTTAGMTPDMMNQIRALVLVDDYTWGSGAWFMKTVCPASVSTALQKGDQAGWEAYLTCVGVDPKDPQRLAFWTRAKSTMQF